MVGRLVGENVNGDSVGLENGEVVGTGTTGDLVGPGVGEVVGRVGALVGAVVIAIRNGMVSCWQ